jgi:hypothetical protein
MSNEPQPSPPPTQFGVFYPLGHVVVALQSREDAERIRQLLIDGGCDERDEGSGHNRTILYAKGSIAGQRQVS